MPIFFKLLTRSCLKGIAVGWTILALFIVTDTGGIGHVIQGAADWALGVFLLSFGFAVTFGSIFMGVAVMSISDSDLEFDNRNMDSSYKFPY